MAKFEQEQQPNPYESPQKLSDLRVPELSGHQIGFKFDPHRIDGWTFKANSASKFDCLENPVEVTVASQAHGEESMHHLERMYLVGIDGHGHYMLQRDLNAEDGICVEGYALEITNPDLVLLDEVKKRDVRSSAFLHLGFATFVGAISAAGEFAYRTFEYIQDKIAIDEASAFTTKGLYIGVSTFCASLIATITIRYRGRAQKKQDIQEEYDEYSSPDHPSNKS